MRQASGGMGNRIPDVSAICAEHKAAGPTTMMIGAAETPATADTAVSAVRAGRRRAQV
jgi:hypothetical protein